MNKLLFVLPQYLLPQHPLSRLIHHLVQCQKPGFKNLLTRAFIRLYRVDLSEAVEPDPDAYPSFNAFFTRALKPESRPVCAEADAIACPADGVISQIGTLAGDRILQAKGRDFSALELLGGDRGRAGAFQDGTHATIYLSPRDYHRLHMPVDGTLREMVHVPGRLFSVNEATTAGVPNLFARNERVLCLFDTAAGPMAVVLVGAIFVASIETVWHGVVTPPTGTQTRSWRYEDDAPKLKKGDELGRFNMGSTVIVLFGRDRAVWDQALAQGTPVRMGQRLGRCLASQA